MARPLDVGGADFDVKVLGARRPAVVDFWAEWCEPCHLADLVVEELTGEWAGEVDFFRVDVDRDGDIADRYQVRSIPTLVVFKEGLEVGRIVGVASKADLKKRIGGALRSALGGR
jgi:thioredoxin 1